MCAVNSPTATNCATHCITTPQAGRSAACERWCTDNANQCPSAAPPCSLANTPANDAVCLFECSTSVMNFGAAGSPCRQWWVWRVFNLKLGIQPTHHANKTSTCNTKIIFAYKFKVYSEADRLRSDVRSRVADCNRLQSMRLDCWCSDAAAFNVHRLLHTTTGCTRLPALKNSAWGKCAFALPPLPWRFQVLFDCCNLQFLLCSFLYVE